MVQCRCDLDWGGRPDQRAGHPFTNSRAIHILQISSGRWSRATICFTGGLSVELLRELMRLQHARGFLDDDSLREIAQQNQVPLYRVEGLVGFYPSFLRSPPSHVSIDLCRDCLL